MLCRLISIVNRRFAAFLGLQTIAARTQCMISESLTSVVPTLSARGRITSSLGVPHKRGAICILRLPSVVTGFLGVIASVMRPYFYVYHSEFSMMLWPNVLCYQC